MKTVKCMGCGGLFPDIDGPVHRYMESSPGCWQPYGEVLSREYSEPAYADVLRWTVDTYAVQHPGTPSRQSIQSVGVHLIRLCFFHEHELSPENANDAMLAAGKNKHSFTWLEPPTTPTLLTAADVAKTQTVEEHKSAVRAWAQSVWEYWSPHHDTIRSWLPLHQGRPVVAQKRHA